jgi:hypothetical protein
VYASLAHDWVLLKTLLQQQIGSLTNSSPMTVSAYSREPYLATMILRTDGVCQVFGLLPIY